MKKLRIAIVGAGPAGLVSAIAGKFLGLDVRVYEQASDFRKVGGGLMLHSNGLRVLESLGILDEFLSKMRFSSSVTLENTDGKVLSETHLDKLRIPQNRTAVVLRYQLQEYLLSKAEEAGVDILFDRVLERAATDNDKAILNFQGGLEEKYDVVIGADGVHSRIRQAIWPMSRKDAVGDAFLRGIAAIPSSSSVIREIWATDGRRFGICPLREDKTYFFCTAPLGQWPAILQGHLERWISSWNDFGSEVTSILRNVPNWNHVNYSELHEVRLKEWHKPPFFLIGDAAHAMTPNLGQGANSAMVDALILMRLLADHLGEKGDLTRIAERHNVIRYRCVSRIQSTARRVGQLAKVKWRITRRLRDMAIRSSVIPAVNRSFSKIMTGRNLAEEEYLSPLTTMHR